MAEAGRIECGLVILHGSLIRPHVKAAAAKRGLAGAATIRKRLGDLMAAMAQRLS